MYCVNPACLDTSVYNSIYRIYIEYCYGIDHSRDETNN